MNNNRLSREFIAENCKSLAHFSKDRRYRYSLLRTWDKTAPMIMFLMLNPSTADESANDRTVDKCMKWAIKWGYGSMTVCNLFAYVETDRTIMVKAHAKGTNIIGEIVNSNGWSQNLNDKVIIETTDKAEKVICAWGNEGAILERDTFVLSLIKNHWPKLYAMKINQNGSPAHPLYLKTEIDPIKFK